MLVFLFHLFLIDFFLFLFELVNLKNNFRNKEWKQEVKQNIEEIEEVEEETTVLPFIEEINVEEMEPIEEIQVETEEEQDEESTASATSSEGNDVVEFAKKYLGYKYVAGGSSPSTGFDCSGFTTYVFRNFGVSLNRSSKDQIKTGTAVSKSNLQPGDIVIFKNQGKTAIGHVGIYIGSGNFIHAANKKEGVVITALSSSYYSQRYVGARRVI